MYAVAPTTTRHLPNEGVYTRRYRPFGVVRARPCLDTRHQNLGRTNGEAGKAREPSRHALIRRCGLPSNVAHRALAASLTGVHVLTVVGLCPTNMDLVMFLHR